MKNHGLLLLTALLAAAVAATASGETLYMTADDATSGMSSFDNWDISGKAVGAPTPENDYVVDETYTIRAPSRYDAVFNGNSLTLGSFAKNKYGVIVGYSRATQKMTFSNDGLFLEQGRLTSWSSGREYTYAGTITVKSPLGYPFLFELSDGTSHISNTNRLTATFKGAADTEFAIVSAAENPLGYVILFPAADTSFAGTLTIGKLDYGRIVRNFPVYVEYQGARTWPGTIRVRGDSKLIPQKSSSLWTIGKLVLDADSVLLTRLAGTATSTVTLKDGLVTEYPVNLTFPSARTSTANTASSTLWTVLTLPADKGDLADNVGDFVLATQPSVFPESLPAVFLKVEKDDAAALQSLVLEQRQIVRLAENNGLSKWAATGIDTAVTNAAAWSDGAVPHGDADYVVDTKDRSLVLPPQELLPDGRTYEFPGSSLTLGANNVNLYSAAATTRIPVLRMANDARYWPACHPGKEGDEIVVEGDAIHLLATDSGQSYFRIYGNRLYRIKAPLMGEGRITVFNNSPAGSRPSATLVFDADNSAFKGRIRVSGSTGSYTTGYANTLLVEEAGQLGGPLDEFTHDALELKLDSTLAAKKDVDFSTPGRGLFIDGSGAVDVADGATLTLGNAVTFSAGATLAKTGAGTVAFGAAPRAAGGSAALAGSGQAAALDVREGCVKALSTDALAGLALSFADGAYLLVDPAATGDVAARGVVDLSANPFGGELPVALDLPAPAADEEYRIDSIAVATVANAATAKALGLSAKKIRNHSIEFGVRENDDGTATVIASIARPGLVLVVR
ncbi:MAG: hypothetical protein IJ783_08730 [Kiritimatiellae bacterium]|nr:hypothetical protein [Kiritimatiellia bacterium]